MTRLAPRNAKHRIAQLRLWHGRIILVYHCTTYEFVQDRKILLSHSRAHHQAVLRALMALRNDLAAFLAVQEHEDELSFYPVECL